MTKDKSFEEQIKNTFSKYFDFADAKLSSERAGLAG